MKESNNLINTLESVNSNFKSIQGNLIHSARQIARIVPESVKKLTIAVDFDGTITYGVGKYPTPGRLREIARGYINRWRSIGHTIIVNTCRNEEHLEMAEEFLKENGIEYDFINQNTPESVAYWGNDCRKISADIMFDDKSGFPVNWEMYDRIVMAKERPTIICIVGESGSGKTMVANYIKEEYGIDQLKSYTTRPKRTPDETGHIFLSNEEFDQIPEDDITVPTKFGDARYCCRHSDIAYKNVYVISEKSFQQFISDNRVKYNIFSLRIVRSEDKRIESVGLERVSRDENEFTMDYSEFDYVIYNLSCEKSAVFSQVDDFITKFQLQ